MSYSIYKKVGQLIAEVVLRSTKSQEQLATTDAEFARKQAQTTSTKRFQGTLSPAAKAAAAVKTKREFGQKSSTNI